MDAFKKFLIGTVIVVVLIIAAVLVGVSLKRLEFDEVGVMYDVAGLKLGNGVKYSGLHSGAPGFTFIKFPAAFKSIEFEELKCFTYDGAEVILDVQYQFKVYDKEIPNILKRFRDYDKYLEMLKHVGQSQFYKSCSRFNAFDIVANRISFANTSEALLRKKYDELHTLINGLQINNIGRPEEYNEAQKSKEAVRENIQIKLKERPEKLTVAETKREKALAEAKIKLQDAEREARITLTIAHNEAELIRKQAQADTEIYLKLPFSDSLKDYLTTEAISSAGKTVKVNFKYP